MNEPRETARTVFGRRASYYTTSPVHADEAGLARLAELAAPEPHWRALDVGTGTGHTAFALAPHVASVVAVDVTPEMLAEAEGLRTAHAAANVRFCLADAQALPFADGAFDLLTCRRAAHHFPDTERAVAEMRRVLRAGGRLVIEDRSVPEDDFVDEITHRLDRLHDPSHVRQYRPSAWRRLLERHGFRLDHIELQTKHRPLTSYTEGTSEEQTRLIHRTVASLDAEQRQRLNLVEADGALRLDHWYVLLSAERA